MLATLAEPPLTGKELVFEPKYDGIRALVEIEPGRAARQKATVRLWSRLGNEKTSQFPSIVHALESFAAEVGEALVIDGEIVALDAKGRPLGFQRLQGRIHLIDAKDVERIDREQPVALIAFDLLREGDDDVRGLPLVERRARLERIIKKGTTAKAGAIRISEQAIGDGRPLHSRAQAEGWEGLIVKEARSPYQSGRRSPTWRKLKLQHEQEFVIGGWTEPRNTRQHFGALLLGVYGESGLGARRSGLGARGSGLEGRQSKRKVAPASTRHQVRLKPDSTTSATRAQGSTSASSNGCPSCSSLAPSRSHRSRTQSRATRSRTGCSPISSRRCASRSGLTIKNCDTRCISDSVTTRNPKVW